MPVVWPDGVLGGRNVVQSKRVCGDTRQAKAGGTPFREEPLSSMRQTIAKRLSEAKVCVCCVCVCVSGCVWVVSVLCVFCVGVVVCLIVNCTLPLKCFLGSVTILPMNMLNSHRNKCSPD